MAETALPFDFGPLEVPDGSRVVEVRAGLRRKRSLLGVLARGLDFPDYFGWNWDALNDCLATLENVDEPCVLLKHADAPGVPGSNMRRIYLEILRDAIASWSQDSQPRLRAEFPIEFRPDVEAALLSSD